MAGNGWEADGPTPGYKGKHPQAQRAAMLLQRSFCTPSAHPPNQAQPSPTCAIQRTRKGGAHAAAQRRALVGGGRRQGGKAGQRVGAALQGRRVQEVEEDAGAGGAEGGQVPQQAVGLVLEGGRKEEGGAATCRMR
jgi:hypothetical protein